MSFDLKCWYGYSPSLTNRPQSIYSKDIYDLPWFVENNIAVYIQRHIIDADYIQKIRGDYVAFLEGALKDNLSVCCYIVIRRKPVAEGKLIRFRSKVK